MDEFLIWYTILSYIICLIGMKVYVKLDKGCSKDVEHKIYLFTMWLVSPLIVPFLLTGLAVYIVISVFCKIVFGGKWWLS